MREKNINFATMSDDPVVEGVFLVDGVVNVVHAKVGDGLKVPEADAHEGCPLELFEDLDPIDSDLESSAVFGDLESCL